MIRVGRNELDIAVESIMILALRATASQGRILAWRLGREAVEKHLCAMLSAMTPTPSPDAVIPADIWMTGMAPEPKRSLPDAAAHEAHEAQSPRPMPNHFWPEGGIVCVGEVDGDQLAFTVTIEEFEDNVVEYVFPRRLTALRRSLWDIAEYRRLSALGVSVPKPASLKS